MPREILIHLNVGLDPNDERSVEDIVAVVNGAIEVGLDPEETALHPSQVVVAMAEEI